MSNSILSLNQLKQMVKNPYINHWYEAIDQLLPDYDINTPARVSAFIAQCAHESGNFVFVKENLNYRAASLRKTFAKYFTDDAIAAAYANKPEKIANRVYANRMGNGDEASGDGYRFCGRGLIQLTGRDNYTRASQQIFGDDRLVKNPDLASRLDVGAQIALWFWKNQVRPNVSNFNNTKEVTNAINPGLSGLQDRHTKFKEYLAVL
jgi:putative chitinase